MLIDIPFMSLIASTSLQQHRNFPVNSACNIIQLKARMPMFRSISRTRSRSRPKSPPACCTTSCGKKPCNCNDKPQPMGDVKRESKQPKHGKKSKEKCCHEKEPEVEHSKSQQIEYDCLCDQNKATKMKTSKMLKRECQCSCCRRRVDEQPEAEPLRKFERREELCCDPMEPEVKEAKPKKCECKCPCCQTSQPEVKTAKTVKLECDEVPYYHRKVPEEKAACKNVEYEEETICCCRSRTKKPKSQKQKTEKPDQKDTTKKSGSFWRKKKKNSKPEVKKTSSNQSLKSCAPEAAPKVCSKPSHGPEACDSFCKKQIFCSQPQACKTQPLSDRKPRTCENHCQTSFPSEPRSSSSKECVRPGCSRRKPCISCCKAGNFCRPTVCEQCGGKCISK